jgi:hypothetical protein
MIPALILGGISYGRVGFTGTALLVRVTNTRTVKCVDCHSNIETGQGIRYKEYRHNGFVCLDCARKNIRIAADRATEPAGYIVNATANITGSRLQTLYNSWILQQPTRLPKMCIFWARGRLCLLA